MNRAKFVRLLATAKRVAKQNKYKSPDATADELEILWKRQGGLCAFCEAPLNLAKTNTIHLEHNHETGQVRGFVHAACNFIEGQVKNFTPQRLKQLIVALYRWNIIKELDLKKLAGDLLKVADEDAAFGEDWMLEKLDNGRVGNLMTGEFRLCQTK
jgi:hypothetical protein